MRRFTAQQRHHAVSVTLTFQRLQIVGDAIRLTSGGNCIARLLVAIGENTHNDRWRRIAEYLVLNFRELLRAVQVPARHAISIAEAFRIGFQRR